MIIEIPDLTGAECGDIAITAAEGGTGYWAQIQSYQYKRWCPDGPDGYIGENLDVAQDFVFYTLAPLNDDEDGYDITKAVDITPALMQRGFELGLGLPRDKGGWMFLNLIQLGRDDWMGNIDADVADAIIQLGCFGEIIYG
jgi:hypothetical protein